MRQPPLSPQSYRVHYHDGRVEMVEARACMRVGSDHVFYSADTGEVLRVAADAVLLVEPYVVPRRAMQRRA
ncbi:MAG: hypothetical protein QOE83_993 [Actinomycetota bacterium]|nr:hypothetical protein [Actinomycetota bacterium]